MTGMTVRSFKHPAHGPCLIAYATVNGKRCSYEEPAKNVDEDLEFLKRAREAFERIEVERA